MVGKKKKIKQIKNNKLLTKNQFNKVLKTLLNTQPESKKKTIKNR